MQNLENDGQFNTSTFIKFPTFRRIARTLASQSVSQSVGAAVEAAVTSTPKGLRAS